MSTLPSLTRSLRKPAESSRHERSATTRSIEVNGLSRDAAPARTSQSPSRLPMKPTTRSTTTTSTTTRPSSHTDSATSSTSMRPPPPRANISKPTSSGLQRSSSVRSSNPPSTIDPVKQDRSRPPITTSRHLRNASTSTLSSSTRTQGHTRTRSSSTLLSSASTTLRPPTREPKEEPKQAAVLPDPQLRKPTFSTLQQHFSPAKSLAPKPHPAAFLAPPSPSKLPSNIAISAETAKLQNELLQLHLLHKDAGRVEDEWRASAKRKLGARFQLVVDRNDELVKLEIAERGKINANALKVWENSGTPGWGLEEKIQMLDEVVTGVWNLGESGGKYSRLVRKFDRWLGRTQDILERRERKDHLADDEVLFLEELDEGWKDDCLIIGRKLATWKDHLKVLGVPENGSSLADVVGGCQRLVNGMLMELSVMSQIERDATKMEVDWIKSMNDDEIDEPNAPVAGAVWRFR